MLKKPQHSVWRKALWYSVVAGASAAVPEIIGAMSSAEAISQVPWVEILDQKGLTFLTTALAGLCLGGGKAAVQNKGLR